jgi:serine/threonine protein kinase
MPIAQYTLKGNILIDDQQNARLCDFGVSRVISNAPGSRSVQTSTVRYLPYELAVLKSKSVTATASDVYALACISLEVSRNNY